MIILNFSHL